ncbi:MAG: ABC transporter ATP-binding protein [Gammaproteobacteria bacterium]|nr:ABC transporter ATP-binding protein [Gammaproteobacteria bacterium]
MAIVETRALSKRFEGAPVVDNINISTREGEFLVLLGPSGSGKTTLLRMVAGLEQPTSGDILIGGKIVTELPPRVRNIAMVFQSYALYPHLSVFKNIAFPMHVQGLDKQAIRRKVDWAAGMFGIAHLLDRKPRQLSGGERQRVALARALVREPVVFLLDEPLSNLDAKLRTSAREDLQQLQRRIGTTTLYVTHDQIEAMGLGDRIAVLNQGRLHQLGTPHEVYDYPADTFVATFIGSPPMNLVTQDHAILGFRPEHFLPKGAQNAGSEMVGFPFQVTHVEYLGADRLVYGVLQAPFPQTKVISRLPSTVDVSIQSGERYEFTVRAHDVKYFDRTSGLKLGEGTAGARWRA